MSDDIPASELEDDNVDWSRRQFLFSMGGLAAAGTAALFAGTPILHAARRAFSSPVESGLFHVYQEDFAFKPSHMTWYVGDEMNMIIQNISPNRYHEMQIGRGQVMYQSDVGTRPVGFKEDFWDGVHVTIVAAEKVDSFMTNKAVVKSLVSPHPWLVTKPGMGHFMPALEPGGKLELRFTVPNKPGHWNYGCFVQDGQHYINGMKGSLEIRTRT